MLTRENLQEFANRYQTGQQNVVREYIQHLFLAALYKQKEAEQLLFKGGTALRLIFQSPRFSEDLDFTGMASLHHQDIDQLFLESLAELEKIGIRVSYQEAKPTTGGYLGIIHYEMFDFSENMKFEVSFRQKQKIRGELTSIASEFAPTYSLVYFPLSVLVFEKTEALLTRKKPRDFYDLFFMLRHPELRQWLDKKKLRPALDTLHNTSINYKIELGALLPESHHILLKDFKKVLEKEINKYLL